MIGQGLTVLGAERITIQTGVHAIRERLGEDHRDLLTTDHLGDLPKTDSHRLGSKTHASLRIV